jgi:alpha-1,6-mannosyltransferase
LEKEKLMPLKTLHLTNSWHPTSGGIATFYRALMEAANQRGHEIRLIVPGETTRTERIGEFARIYYLKAPRARFNPAYRILYPTQYLAPNSPIQQILSAERPDIVEICDKYTLNYLGALLRRGLLRGLDFRPLVIGLSCERMDDNFQAYIGRVPLSRVFCAAYLKWVYFPFFDHHIANSEYTSEELRIASQGQMVSRNIWIRSMGVDLRRFSPLHASRDARSRLRKSYGGDDDTVVLVYSGRLVPEKNLSLLFDVFVRLVKDAKRDFRLVVAGDGIERSRWEAFCASHAPGRSVFLGHIKDPAVLADLLANADAFIHPNHREPFGIAPLEAMASGLPLVVPDRGGVRSYADSETAWAAAPDPASFVSAIYELLGNEREKTRRAQNALRRAAEFCWEKRAAAFLDLYADLSAAFSAGALGPPLASTAPRSLKLLVARGVSQSAEAMFRRASMLLYPPRPR